MRAVGRAATLLSLVLAVTVAVATYLVWSSRPTVDDHPLTELASAVGSALPFQARLTGGFVPSQGPTVVRSEGAASSRLSPDTRIAIAQIEKRAAADPNAETFAALGVAYLVQGDVDRSISTLQDAVSMGDAAAPLSDLSAAYLAKAERMPARRIEYFSRALEAASQSLKRAPMDEARFNRALAIDGLTPFVGETQPWTEYLNAERDPRWLEVAKNHVADAKPVDDVRERWARRQGELRERLLKLDRAFVEETVRLFPEASIEFLEQELLVGWAKATLASDGIPVQSAVDQAGLIAEAIAAVTGDRLPSQQVKLLRSRNLALARGHLAYARGLEQYAADDYKASHLSFDQALTEFGQTASPYRLWVDVQLATLLYQQRDLAGADRLLAAVETAARDGKYQTLLGRTYWLRGLVYSKQWRLTQALAAFRAGLACFGAAGQRENVASLHSHLADALRTLGEDHESWEEIGLTLEGLSQVRRPIRRYLFLYNASLFASSRDLLEAALLFQNATVREASNAAVGVLVDALTQRAAIHLKRGDRASAEADLEQSARRVGDVPDQQLRNYHQAEIDILSAQLRTPHSDDRLKRAIGFFQIAEPGRVPSLYLALAKSAAVGGTQTQIEGALEEGIQQLERRHADLREEAFRISYFDESWALFQEMVAFQINVRKNQARAFEYAERSRGRSLLAAQAQSASARPRTLDEIQQLLPGSVVVVYYVTLTDRLLTWTITSRETRFIEARVTERDLVRLIAQFRSALLEGRDAPVINDRLHRLLIEPVAGRLQADQTIVLVPDGQLQQLPFASLRHPQTRRYLIEDHAFVVTPSASFYAAGIARSAQLDQRPLGSALLVGNPTTAAVTLPGAEAEVTRAAAFYPHHEVLTGAGASKARFIAKAPAHDVVHFGGHAFANAEYPLLSRLSFAGAEESEQSLFAHEISALRFPATRVVVLAACSTGAGTVSRGEGIVSVARPFLGSGVPIVVASQWDVDDRATEQLFLEFHRLLAETRDPIRALQSAQVKLLRSPNSLLASPASWGAFVALGTTAR
jgi:CHAT domain-containing protein